MIAKSLTEREKMRLVPGIDFIDALDGQRAHVAGTGLDVVEVIKAYHDFDDDAETLVDELSWLAPEQIEAALAYYRHFPDEIDTWLAISEALIPEGIRST